MNIRKAATSVLAALVAGMTTAIIGLGLNLWAAPRAQAASWTGCYVTAAPAAARPLK